MVKLIDDYVRDLTPFDITDGAIENVLIDAGVLPGVDILDLTPRQMDLCKAYTYLWCASAPIISGSVEDSDSGWSHRDGGKQITVYDKRRYYRMGLALLKKYGLCVEKSTIHIATGGMRVFPRRK